MTATEMKIDSLHIQSPSGKVSPSLDTQTDFYLLIKTYYKAVQCQILKLCFGIQIEINGKSISGLLTPRNRITDRLKFNIYHI